MSALKKYYRKPQMNIELPSQGYFNEIPDDERTIFKEVGVMPLTTMNELTLKNPEMLINGAAIEEIIRDCTNLSINPRNMIKADIDALLIGIKIVSQGNNFQEYELKCQNKECQHEFTYQRNLDKVLNTIEPLDKEYHVNVHIVDDVSIDVYLRPSTFEQYMQLEDVTFREKKKIDEIEQNLNEIQKEDREFTEEDSTRFFGMMSNVFTELTMSTIELFAGNILYVYINDNDLKEDEKLVKDKEGLIDWLKQLDTKSFKKIRDKISEINDKGLNDVEEIECPECKKKFEQYFDINRSDFFANGS